MVSMYIFGGVLNGEREGNRRYLWERRAWENWDGVVCIGTFQGGFAVILN